MKQLNPIFQPTDSKNDENSSSITINISQQTCQTQKTINRIYFKEIKQTPNPIQMNILHQCNSKIKSKRQNTFILNELKNMNLICEFNQERKKYILDTFMMKDLFGNDLYKK